MTMEENRKNRLSLFFFLVCSFFDDCGWENNKKEARGRKKMVKEGERG